MGAFVLIVDDNQDAADLLAQLIRCLGHQALAVYHGQTAIRQAAIQKPDLVLVDLNMPDMDGFTVADAIRQQSGGSHVVIVAVTGLKGEDAKRHAYEAGFDLYLTKPVSIEALIDLLAIRQAPSGKLGDLAMLPRWGRSRLVSGQKRPARQAQQLRGWSVPLDFN